MSYTDHNAARAEYQAENENPRLNRAERRRMKRECEKTDQKEIDGLFRGSLLDMGIELGIQELGAICEKEADELCGAPKGKHNEERRAYRHGRARGEIYIGGMKCHFMRPRIRNEEGELTLTAYEYAQSPEHFSETVLIQCLLGVSQRDYERGQEVILHHSGHGISKSSVGRNFVRGTQKLLMEFLSRKLDDERYLVIFLDGHELGDHIVICALGITDTGQKKILGLWEGATENREVSKALLTDLQDRGLCIEKGLLVITDGGKGLKAAINEVWGEEVLVQRCQIHKKRNVKEHLPEKEHGWVTKKLDRAFFETDPQKGREDLLDLARLLEDAGHQSAANSVREGLDEMFTCRELGISEGLISSLTNTNIIESTFSRCADIAKNVKRWQNGNQVLRWMALGCIEAERSFNTVADKGGLEDLALKLARYADERELLQASVPG